MFSGIVIAVRNTTHWFSVCVTVYITGGTFGNESANENCFTMSSVNVTATSDGFNSR